MSLLLRGVSTFIQCRRIGPIGAKLLCIQGTSFSFIGPIIATGLVGGLPLIFGSCIAAAPIEMVVSRTFKYLRNIITPASVRHCRTTDRIESDQSRYRFLWRRI